MSKTLPQEEQSAVDCNAMEDGGNQASSQGVKCAICGTTINLLRCSKCKTIYYCSVAHQHLDWPKHRRKCRKMAEQRQNIRVQQLTKECSSINLTSAPCRNDAPSTQSMPSEMFDENCDQLGAMKQNPADNAILNANAYMHPTRVACKFQDFPPPSSNTEFADQQQQQQQQQIVYSPQQTTLQTNYIDNQIWKASNYQLGTPICHESSTENDIERRYADLCRNIISDMNQYGLSVIDDFLGMEKGMQVVKEVHNMYAAGVFKDGQLVNPTKLEQDHNARTIRGDKITWVKGIEFGCLNIGYLINQIDAVICKANTMSNNGKLGDYIIKERTKAMVACYPGSGSHYIMHVDNPNRDGRVITAIYYLNVNWDAKKNGGVLRIFPEKTNYVADIEPQFDRLIFFWSDKRNPHEVQPSHQTRYAITVWYFDANEREEALNRYKTIAKIDKPLNHHNPFKIDVDKIINNRNNTNATMSKQNPPCDRRDEETKTNTSDKASHDATSSVSLMLAGNL